MEMYQFIKQIGQGRYGDIWLVKGAKTKKNYILKRINFHPFHKRTQRAAHLEVKLLCTVRHPNIITYLDSFHNSRGSLFIVMSYCEDGNLHDYIKNRHDILFEEKEVIKWFVQICMALKYLHDQSILHRDIKTQNLFLTRQKAIKVGDFGISRIFNAIESMSTSLVSSPSYTSPEIYNGAPFGPKSDVWSVGCCVFEIATLRYAFVSQEIFTLTHLAAIQTKLSTIPQCYSSELRYILQSMLNLDAEKRPSATELLLKDYVRKHIVHFLHDSPQRNDSSQSSCRETILSGDSYVNSKSKSSLHLRTEEQVKSNNIKTREGFKTIPDINGNGDANDNSQQQAAILKNTLDAKTKSSFCLNLSNSQSEKHPKSAAGTKILSEVNNLHMKNPPLTYSKQVEKRNDSIIQKMRSETSFQFLNHLTSSINISRFQSLDSFNDNNISFEEKHRYWQIPPKSAEDLFSMSKKFHNHLAIRPATSAEINFNVIPSNFGGSCLPVIKEGSAEKNYAKNKFYSVGLPPLFCSELSESKNAEEPKHDCLPKLEESIVDKFLLQNIIECNTKQKERNDSGISSNSSHKLSKDSEPSKEGPYLKNKRS